MISYGRLLFSSHGARVEGRSAIMLLQIPAVLYVQAGGVFEQLLIPVAALIPGWPAFSSPVYWASNTSMSYRIYAHLI
jgi:hypothetical protein